VLGVGALLLMPRHTEPLTFEPVPATPGPGSALGEA
jgi:hypothetical protein